MRGMCRRWILAVPATDRSPCCPGAMDWTNKCRGRPQPCGSAQIVDNPPRRRPPPLSFLLNPAKTKDWPSGDQKALTEGKLVEERQIVPHECLGGQEPAQGIGALTVPHVPAQEERLVSPLQLREKQPIPRLDSRRRPPPRPPRPSSPRPSPHPTHAAPRLWPCWPLAQLPQKPCTDHPG